jgi:MFS family permease
MARIFRPTLLTVFDISNTELGAYFSVYGVVAMISYIFGGTLADRFPARNLMAIALWLTSLGGFIMIFLPSSLFMLIIYGFWGFTTVFLFWAALIRATREWGGEGFQGRAFGWLEGGRGASAALLGTVVFILFSWISPAIPSSEVPEGGFHAFQYVILAISVVTLLSGGLVWLFVPAKQVVPDSTAVRIAVRGIVKMVRMPTIWLLSIMIICAYAGYKITDDFSLYAREVLGFSEIGAAGIGTAALWVRAIVAILAGYTADRLNRTSVIMACFALTVGGGLLVGLGLLNPVIGLALFNLTLTAIGIYGIRALYFAILKEAGIPLAYTGTAVGIVCFVGFTPDVFMSPWMGYLLDKYPGAPGHQYVFLVLALFAFIGLLTSLLFKYHRVFNTLLIRLINRFRIRRSGSGSGPE